MAVMASYFRPRTSPIIFSINIIIALIVEIPKPDIIPKLKTTGMDTAAEKRNLNLLLSNL